jgi:hypothetical protein
LIDLSKNSRAELREVAVLRHYLYLHGRILDGATPATKKQQLAQAI